jgi:hypothetical protein
MKFETPIGLGEVVIIEGFEEKCTERAQMSKLACLDFFGEVVGITIEKDVTKYQVKFEDNAHRLMLGTFTESELLPDPEFDHEKGCYPNDIQGA